METETAGMAQDVRDRQGAEAKVRRSAGDGNGGDQRKEQVHMRRRGHDVELGKGRDRSENTRMNVLRIQRRIRRGLPVGKNILSAGGAKKQK